MINETSEKKKEKKKKKKKSKKRAESYRDTDRDVDNDIAFPETLNEAGRVPGPKQPATFIAGNLKAAAGKTGGPNLMMGGGNGSDDEGPKNFFEPISYAKLMRVIAACHPYDTETKSRFNIKDRVTINDYTAKLSDACFCYAIG